MYFQQHKSQVFYLRNQGAVSFENIFMSEDTNLFFFAVICEKNAESNNKCEGQFEDRQTWLFRNSKP